MPNYGPYGGLIDSSNAQNRSSMYVQGPTAAYMGAQGQGQPGQMYNTVSKQWETPDARYTNGTGPSSMSAPGTTPQMGFDPNGAGRGSGIIPGGPGPTFSGNFGDPWGNGASRPDQSNPQGDYGPSTINNPSGSTNSGSYDPVLNPGGARGMPGGAGGSITGGLGGLAGMDPGMMQRLYAYMNQFRGLQNSPGPSTNPGWNFGNNIYKPNYTDSQNLTTLPYRVPPGGNTSGAFYGSPDPSQQFQDTGLSALSRRMGNNAYSGMSPFRTSQGFRGY